MNAWNRFRGRLAAILTTSLFLLVACHLTKEDEVIQVFTFQTLADSLQGTDTALIVLKDRAGKPIDTLFHGPVAGATFANLESDRYKGGPVTITVEGFKDGKLVYKLHKEYSGESGKDTTLVIIARPVVRNVKVDNVDIHPDSLSLNAKGAEGILTATIHPDSADQRVSWQSLEPAKAAVTSQGRVSGLDTGRARIVAWSVSDGKISDTIWVTVSAPPRVEKISFDRSSLDLYVGGAAESLKVTILPEGADPRVRLSSENPLVASLENGKVTGKQAGETRIIAVSLEDTAISAALRVVVLPKPADPVDSITVSPDTLQLYMGGEALSLAAVIHPRTLKPQFVWYSAAIGIAQVDASGKVSPVSAGRTFVRARSLVDSTKGDSALVLVKKDVPRIAVGKDTTISVGSSIAFNPVVTQDYGTIEVVRWDLDGNGAWEDSATSFRPLTQAYPEAKEYAVRFYARDSEGNDTLVIKKVKAVNGPVILFKSPADGAYVNASPITVTWSVDGVEQTGSEALKPGANTLTRSATNAAGETFSASITVHLDTDPPARPIVKGPASPTSGLRPAWSWESAGGGNGTYRYRLNLDNFTTGANLGTDTAYTPPTNLVGGTHTLYVQERDQAGNWSPSGSFAVRIDTTAPPAPVVTGTTPSPTNQRRPTWTWTGSASEGLSSYRFKLDNPDLRAGAVSTSTTTFTVPAGNELSEGPHTLFVQQSDSAGNWSASGSAQIFIDLTPPLAPRVTAPTSPTNDRTPTWTFTSRGGGNGVYRFKLNDRNLSSGATESTNANFTPNQDLAAGLHTLHIQERDTAGNWSPSDSASVTIDLSTPSAPSVNLVGRSPTNNQTPGWSWRSAAGGTGYFRYKFNDPNLSTGATETRDTVYTHSVALPEGIYSLFVQERNSAGTWSSAGSRQVRIDLTKPTAPTVSLVQSSPTNERRPTWNWTKSEPGAGSFRFSLDDAAYRDTTSTSYRPYQNLSDGNHTLRIQERDSAGNWSDPGSATINIDITPPNPPSISLSQPRSPLASLRPVFTWSSGGNGGSGQFRYRLNNGAYSAWSTSTSYQPPSQSEGEHIFYVQERDALGNESAESSRKITLLNRGLIGTTAYSLTTFTVSSANSASGILHSAVSEDSAGKVYYFNNNTWSVLGNAPFAKPAFGPVLAFSKDTAFVVYSEPNGDNFAIKVKKYVQGNWVQVGTVVHPGTSFYYLTMAIGPNGTPYVTWINGNTYEVEVSVFNRSQSRWDAISEKVGTSTDDGGYTAIGINDANEVYVAYTDWNGVSGHPVVKRLEGSVWREVARYPKSGVYLSLAFHGNNPWLAFVSYQEVTLIQYNSGWTPLSEYSISGDEPALGLSTHGTPYLAYKTFAASDNVHLVTPIDGKLVQVGPASGSSSTGTGGLNVTISPSGIPQVTFTATNLNWNAAGYKFGFDP